jgi:hypothetical protein
MNLVERVKRILFSPQTEWPIIDTEPTTTTDLYKQYIIPLAAIGPAAQFIGFALVGIGGFRTPIVSAFVSSVVLYAMTLVGTYVLALIINELAPSFNGKKNQLQALKVAAYSMTAAWVVGIFALIPFLSPLMIAGLYSVYLLYLGLPVLMKNPRDRSLLYTGVVIIAAIIVNVIIWSISYCFMPIQRGGLS